MNKKMENSLEMAARAVREGNVSLGIEFGSTRIKAVLTGPDYAPIAMGTYDWENRLEGNIWTYGLEDILEGLRTCYGRLAEDVKVRYGQELRTLGALGISGMMHGYLVFDREGRLLTPFRTWRNTITEEACGILTPLFFFNIPQRWSIAHLYQAVLNGEVHVKDISYMTTLSGYIHWILTGRRVLGVGDASGMFPIDAATGDFNDRMMAQFDKLIEEKGYPWKLRDILPEALRAGEAAGTLTREGAGLLDPSGTLQAGVAMCPPEGDAGTGMAATNSVAVRTGNVSAGTSVFAMVVLEKELAAVHEEIDMVTTPDGSPVAMVHCNNCTSDLNAWVDLFGEFAECVGAERDKGKFFNILFRKALEGEPDCGGLLSYNYVSGEPIMGFDEGRPVFARTPESRMNLANFMKVHLYGAVAALKIGMDILIKQENVRVDCLMGHGGFFKTPDVGQRIMAAAMNTPVAVMETAGEGGAWGIAVLASYLREKEEGMTLPEYLERKIFAGEKGTRVAPREEDVAGFETFAERYVRCLSGERAMVENLR